MRYISLLTILSIIICTASNCKKPDYTSTLNDINNTLGFGVLSKINGIWNGSLTSTTALGSYPEWIVDFRPISENQISAKNELDSLNDIHLSFFIAKYKDEYRVCFRNGGSFAGNTRVSYFLADSVYESSTESYYRFSEIIKGKNRAYTELIFRSDSVYLKSYTNVYNTLAAPALHMSWSAKKQDITSSQTATALFDFPKKTLTKDFTSSFDGITEAIFYNSTSDPYAESAQTYLGKTTINYTYASGYTPSSSKKVFLLITTQPLITGFSINTANMIYRSRYVILSATDQNFDFNYMHPGTYYVYALYDADGNNYFSSGDWTSTTNTTFTLGALATQTATTQINFTIP